MFCMFYTVNCKMKNCREEWYDKEAKVAVTVVDVTDAAQALARGHLCGPTSAYFLSKALAAAALLGGEMSEADETLALQMKCEGPLGGFNVECTAAGTLRGYTERKVLDGFDGMGPPDCRKAVGRRQIQVVRSVPGRILSQGVSTSLDGYLAGSLQRRAAVFLEAAVSDDVEVSEARGVMVEELPDAARTGVLSVDLLGAARAGALAVSSRNILGRLGLARAELRRTTPLSFACRCSPGRAAAMLAALPPGERAALPPAVDVTCHMCGRTFTVRTK
jgi:molecular chaperone Hsp33